VPVFVRVLTEISPMHNQKQNKIPLKKDGISLDAIYGPGRDAADNLREGKDVLYWWPASLGMKAQTGSGGVDSYVVLTRSDWATILEKSKEGQPVEHLSRL
jgi:hypothetical protein